MEQENVTQNAQNVEQEVPGTSGVNADQLVSINNLGKLINCVIREKM